MSDTLIKKVLKRVLEEMGVMGADVRLERPKDPNHGDWATNLALTLASQLKKSPRQIAQEIADRFDPAEAGVEGVEIAGPGFLNFRLSSGAVAGAIPQILAEARDYGRSRTGGGEPFMVEFVSANPTGPLHLGHGRQAALGDAISSLLEWTGWSVHREYYYNDAGRQMELLAESVWARYQELLGESVELPEGGYQGEYVRDLAEALVSSEGSRFKGDQSPEALDFMREFAVRVLRKEQDGRRPFGVRRLLRPIFPGVIPLLRRPGGRHHPGPRGDWPGLRARRCCLAPDH
jgi:arginyl-tRNA synthetase